HRRLGLRDPARRLARRRPGIEATAPHLALARPRLAQLRQLDSIVSGVSGLGMPCPAALFALEVDTRGHGEERMQRVPETRAVHAEDRGVREAADLDELLVGIRKLREEPQDVLVGRDAV